MKCFNIKRLTCLQGGIHPSQNNCIPKYCVVHLCPQVSLFFFFFSWTHCRRLKTTAKAPICRMVPTVQHPTNSFSAEFSMTFLLTIKALRQFSSEACLVLSGVSKHLIQSKIQPIKTRALFRNTTVI